jgi:hypothetical protein
MEEGFLVIIMVKNLLKFSQAISCSHYAKTQTEEEIKKENIARWRYWLLINWFHQNYVLLMEDYHVTLWYVVQLSIVRFATTICKYMSQRKKNTSEVKGCSEKKFHTTIMFHLC